jgi:hypothetical protein
MKFIKGLRDKTASFKKDVESEVKNLETRLNNFFKSPPVQNVLEPIAFSTAYVNGVLGNGEQYHVYQNYQWINPGLLAEIVPLYIAEMIGDAARANGGKAAKYLQIGVDVLQYGVGIVNLGIALWYTPLTGAAMRAVAGPELSSKIDNSLDPIYGWNPTVPLGIAAASFYAARKENESKVLVNPEQKSN